MSTILTQMGSKAKYCRAIKDILSQNSIDYNIVVEPFSGTAAFSLSHTVDVPFIINDISPFNMMLFYSIGKFPVGSKEIEKSQFQSTDDAFMDLLADPYYKGMYSNFISPIWDSTDFFTARHILSQVLRFYVRNKEERLPYMMKYYYNLVNRDEFNKYPFSSEKIKKLFLESPAYPILLFNRFSYGGVLRCNKEFQLNMSCRWKNYQLPKPLFTKKKMDYEDFIIMLYKISTSTLSVGDYREVIRNFAYIIEGSKVLFFIDPPYIPEEGTSTSKGSSGDYFFNSFGLDEYKDLLDRCLKIKEANPDNYFAFCHSHNNDISRMFADNCRVFSYERDSVHLGTSQSNSEHEHIEYLYVL